MKRGTKPTAEQIVNLRRQVEVGVANGEGYAPGVQGSGDCGADVLPVAIDGFHVSERLPIA